MLEKFSEDRDATLISLSLDQTVTITESSFPSPSLTTLLAEMGGSLGLWLGVGVVQIMIYVSNVTNIRRIKNFAGH